jgi:hypothetical protein
MSKKYFNRDGFLVRTLPNLKGSTELHSKWRKVVTSAARLHPDKSVKNTQKNFHGKYEPFKRAAYQIGRHCDSEDKERLFKKIVLTIEKDHLSRSELQQALQDASETPKNLFDFVYRLFKSSKVDISRPEKKRSTTELTYAMNHNVPPEYLTGFIAQSGGNLEVLRKLKADKREPWHEWRQKMDG